MLWLGSGQSVLIVPFGLFRQPDPVLGPNSAWTRLFEGSMWLLLISGSPNQCADIPPPCPWDNPFRARPLRLLKAQRLMAFGCSQAQEIKKVYLGRTGSLPS